MTGIIKTGALTAAVQLVNVALNMAPTMITLNSSDPSRAIRLSSSRSGAANTFFAPTVDGSAAGAISCATLAPVVWVEFTGAVGDTYEVV